MVSGLQMRCFRVAIIIRRQELRPGQWQYFRRDSVDNEVVPFG